MPTSADESLACTGLRWRPGRGLLPGSEFPNTPEDERMPIRVKSRGNETVEQMVRRFKKLCEKEGLTKDLKARQFHEKPSEVKRRMDIRREGLRMAARRAAAAKAAGRSARPAQPSKSKLKRGPGGRGRSKD